MIHSVIKRGEYTIEKDPKKTEIDITLDDLFTADALANTKAISQAAYEEKIVKKVLTTFGLGDQVKQLTARVKEKTGTGKLSFLWFFEEYPSFPIWLTARRIPFVYQVSVPTLFNKFISTPMYKMWTEVRDENPFSGKPTGLIFDWPGMKGQMIIHNLEYNPKEYVHFSFLVGSDWMTIEPLDMLLTVVQEIAEL